MGAAGPAGPPGVGSVIRVVTGQAKAACEADEIMISAYCTGEGGALHIEGTAGASCAGPESTATVVACVKR
ncbi:MAG: hypothetical protein ABSC22_05750 [Roseiarcus sp.]|jgi:hypothetical protein